MLITDLMALLLHDIPFFCKLTLVIPEKCENIDIYIEIVLRASSYNFK